MLIERGDESPLFYCPKIMVSKERVIALIEERIEDLQSDLYMVELTISAKNVIRVEIDKLDGSVSVCLLYTSPSPRD